MLYLLRRETPELPKTGRRRRRDTRARPQHSPASPQQHRERLRLCTLCSRRWEKHKRQTRSTARIRKRNTSDENWERSHHEPDAESLDMEVARFPRLLPKEGLAVERVKAGTEREEG